MADIFMKEDFQNLLKNKKVVFIGDSNVRSYYKDFLCLFWESKIVSSDQLRTKMEKSVFKDSLTSHGKKTNGREYREERKFIHEDYHFEFYFITRVFNDHVVQVLKKVNDLRKPDVIIMNSCLWDLCRWGPNGVMEYKENVVRLMKYLNENIPEECLVIWVTAPPTSADMRGGFLVVQLEFLKYCLRFHVMEANEYCRKVIVAYGYDVVDIHYHLRLMLHLRVSDGIHWSPMAVRYITNLLLTHISLAWEVPLPHRYKPLITLRTLEESGAVGDFEDRSTSPVIKRIKQEPKGKKIMQGRAGTSVHNFEVREKRKKSKKHIKVWASNPECTRPFNQGTSPALLPLQQVASGKHPLLPPSQENTGTSPSLLPLPQAAFGERPLLPPSPHSLENTGTSPALLPLLQASLLNMMAAEPVNNGRCQFVEPCPVYGTQGCHARVIYDFPAKSPSELHAMKGQAITLIRKINSNWYEARLGDRVGIIPCSYVLVLPNQGETFQFSFEPKVTWF